MNEVAIKRVVFFPVLVGLVLCYLWLSLNTPLTLFVGARHDDAWFIRTAQSLAAGQWLGTFDHMTLIKGLGFPYFLAVNHWAGFPLALSQALLHLLACAMLGHVLLRAGAQRWALWLLLTCLLFQPALLPMRVIRDYVYASMALMVLSGVIGFAACAPQRLNRLFVGAAGLAGGCFWITREEGVWILPACAFGVLYGAWRAWHQRETRSFLGRLLLFGLCGGVPIVVTAGLNAQHYGVFSTVDFKNPAFKEALNALNRVKVGDDVRFVPVPAHRRQAIYAVSPAFRELRAHLEGAGKSWTRHGCGLYPHTCGDYAGGWFMWALREAVSRSGHYVSAASAEAYYGRLADEIEAACSNGSLACRGASLIPFMPELSGPAMAEVPGKLRQAIALTLYDGRGILSLGPSDPTVALLSPIQDFLGGVRIVPPRPTVGDGVAVLQGWYHGPSAGWIEMRCLDGGRTVSISVERRPSPDIARYFRDTKAGYQRYDIEVDGSRDCGFHDLATGELIIRVKDVDSNYRTRIQSGDNLFYVDDILPSTLPGTIQAQLHPDWLERHLPGVVLSDADVRVFKSALFKAYQGFSPYMFGAGLLAFFGGAFLHLRRRSAEAGLLVAAACLWGAYAVRIVVVVLVDVTSFPAVHQLYLLPAFSLVAAASGTSLLALSALVMRGQRKLCEPV